MKSIPTPNLQERERETNEPTNCKTFHLMQDVSKGKERKTHPSCDVDANGDAH
jgi:hypothetical protein